MSKYNVIRPEGSHKQIGDNEIKQAKDHLAKSGWALFRGFDVDMTTFSGIVARFCSQLTFDPARQYSSENTQKVDAGVGPIGLHIENGNTPFPPDVVSFYARKAAFEGSQTTICDGNAVWDAFSDQEKELWSQSITVKRTLPTDMWKKYVANEHPKINDVSEVTEEHLNDILQAVPGQSGELNEDGSLTYELEIDPTRQSKLSNLTAFANAIPGPSFNYNKPLYTRANGDVISDSDIEKIRDFAEPFTVEINWQDGDIIVADNLRILHGRRAIKDASRELYIGMGNL